MLHMRAKLSLLALLLLAPYLAVGASKPSYKIKPASKSLKAKKYKFKKPKKQKAPRRTISQTVVRQSN